MKSRLISVDIHAVFGFLKRPDVNESIYLTYNCLHRPALLGILGAIVGLGGFYQAFIVGETTLPDYYEKLADIKLGIRPLQSSNGTFQKVVVNYTNTVGYANREPGGTLQVSEQTLLKPGFRIYLLLDIGKEVHAKLHHCLQSNEAEYIPYLGKNDFQLWWDNFREYDFSEFGYDSDFEVATLFIKDTAVREDRRGPVIDLTRKAESTFIYFENLPYRYDEKTKNYQLKPFAYTNARFSPKYKINDLYRIKGQEALIQLF